MKKLLVAILLLAAGAAHAQSSVPKFKGNAAKTDNPFTSVTNYDLILGCRAYDNISHEVAFNVLVLKSTHWKKLTYKTSVKNALFEVTDPQLKELPVTDAECEALYKN